MHRPRVPHERKEDRQLKAKARLCRTALATLATAVLASVASAPAFAATSVTPDIATQVAWASAKHRDAVCRPTDGTAASGVLCVGRQAAAPSPSAHAGVARPHTRPVTPPALRPASLKPVARPAARHGVKPARSRPAAAGAGPGITPPAQCVNTPLDPGNVFDSNAPDRWTTCAKVVWNVEQIETVDGEEQVVGFLLWRSTQWATFSTLANDPTWNHGVILRVGYADGTLADELVTLSSYCPVLTTPLCRETGAIIPDGDELEMLPGTTWSNVWGETDLQIQSFNTSLLDGEIATFMTFAFETIADDGTDIGTVNVGGGDIPPGGGGLVGHCDTVVVRDSAQCVNDDYLPTVNFDATAYSTVGPVADHVIEAQHALQGLWGVPFRSDLNPGTPYFIHNPLRRDMNQADIDANNRMACGPSQPPPGFNCDEYPMATTYEGAAFNGDFSVKNVPAAANSSQGGILGSFYRTYRVIDGDYYWVQATDANGTPSWVYYG